MDLVEDRLVGVVRRRQIEFVGNAVENDLLERIFVDEHRVDEVALNDVENSQIVTDLSVLVVSNTSLDQVKLNVDLSLVILQRNSTTRGFVESLEKIGRLDGQVLRLLFDQVQEVVLKTKTEFSWLNASAALTRRRICSLRLISRFLRLLFTC